LLTKLNEIMQFQKYKIENPNHNLSFPTLRRKITREH
jgi:hypothetical protein